MALSKRHFEAHAAILKERLDFAEHQHARHPDQYQAARDAIWNVAVATSSYFKRENDRFDEDRFLTACGFPRK